jgi:ATP adenylyltransferase
MEYVLGPKQQGRCVFCFDAAAPEEELRERLVVVTTERTLVMLNRYPFAAGHLLVVPRRHLDGLDDLDADEHADFFRVLGETVARLQRSVRAEGMNVGINLGAAAGAGIAEHLHAHVVPRWSGDTNFMPVVGATRVIPQALDDTREHLAKAFADLPGRRSS